MLDDCVCTFLEAAGPSTYQQIADGIGIPYGRAKYLTDVERSRVRVVRVGKTLDKHFVFGLVQRWVNDGMK